MVSDLDTIWKALSDKTRRQILKLLRQKSLGTTEIVETIPHLTRFGVMKHLGVLREAGLVTVRKEGTRRLNTLNVVPIRQVYDELVHGYQDVWAGQLTSLKRQLESGSATEKAESEATANQEKASPADSEDAAEAQSENDLA